MKILVLTDLFPSPHDPNHGIFIYQWAFHLAQKCDLTVYQVIFQEKSRLISDQELVHFRENFRSDQRFVWTQRVKVIGCFDRIWRRSYQFYRLAKVGLKHSVYEFDLIVGQMGCPGGYAAVRLAKKFGKKSVIGLRGSDVNLYFSVPILKYLIKYTVKNTHHLIPVSEALQKELIRRGTPELKITTIYNGIDAKIFTPKNRNESRRILNLPLESKIILYVGSLEIKHKGLDLLFEAISQITTPNCCFILLGGGEDQPQIESSIHNIPSHHRIFLHEPVPHSALNDWYNAADLIILPSRREGVPNVILEAMATGTPVVASDSGGIPEIVVPGMTGFLHSNGSGSDLAVKIEQALRHPWSRTAIIEHSRRFSWNRNAHEYFIVLQKLVKSDD